MNFKFNHRVTFQEEGHKYTSTAGDRYISVTTLLGSYAEPFMEEYWSDYKAVKDIANNMGVFHRIKEAAGGWEGVVAYARKHFHEWDLVMREQIIKRKQQYLKDWEDEREYASALGNKHHNDLEGLLLHTKRISLDKGEVADVSAGDILDMQQFNRGSNRSFPELLIWNDQFKLAGQADVVEKIGTDIHIKDYKTCKVIEFEAFMDKKMLEPLEQLPAMNYSKFTMQLSTYGWMLEQLGYTVKSLTIVHIDRITGNHIEDYPVAYRKDLVIKMLEHYDREGVREFPEKHVKGLC